MARTSICCGCKKQLTLINQETHNGVIIIGVCSTSGCAFEGQTNTLDWWYDLSQSASMQAKYVEESAKANANWRAMRKQYDDDNKGQRLFG